MKIKAVLFDLDGTLLDSVPAILLANKEVCSLMKLPYDEIRWRNYIGIPLTVQALKYAGDRASEFIDNYRIVYRKYQSEDTRLFPSTLTMLDKIKSNGYLTALVTSKSARATQDAIQRTGMIGKFDTIITADDVQNYKPHPEPLLKALDALAIKPEDAIYVGDSLFDIDTAQKAEVAMVCVSWGARSKDDLLLMCPNGVFDSWPEFLGWLDEQA